MDGIVDCVFAKYYAYTDFFSLQFYSYGTLKQLLHELPEFLYCIEYQ